MIATSSLSSTMVMMGEHALQMKDAESFEIRIYGVLLRFIIRSIAAAVSGRWCGAQGRYSRQVISASDRGEQTRDQ